MLRAWRTIQCSAWPLLCIRRIDHLAALLTAAPAAPTAQHFMCACRMRVCPAACCDMLPQVHYLEAYAHARQGSALYGQSTRIVRDAQQQLL